MFGIKQEVLCGIRISAMRKERKGLETCREAAYFDQTVACISVILKCLEAVDEVHNAGTHCHANRAARAACSN